ncbi:MAG: hypothetical protein J6T80_00140 [Paludibacteraceae bacterium]|nr:hypothetical protein [Paludibacteraceae bacterium]
MKKVSVLALAALCLTGCWTRIWTIAPTEPVAVTPQPTTTTVVTEKPTVVVVEQPAQPTVYTTQTQPTTVYTTPTQPTVYTTTVATPTTTTVSTFTVTNYNTDPCFYLDLNAVAAAFAESRSVREFEQLLNSSRYMINNLDLNHDGWIDYLRVIETYQGYYHACLIQACLAPGIFQDVATVVAERRSDRLYVEVVGDRYLYGYNYIVRPVFIKRSPMWDTYGVSNYSCWSSPYYYGYYPSYYTKPQPVFLNHYQAYVNTYLSNHHYCHSCDYPNQPFYNGYTSMTQPYSRNDFREQYPDNSFERRVSRTANGNQAVANARNAGQLRTEVARQSTSSNTSTSSSTTTSGSSRTGNTTSTSTTTSSSRTGNSTSTSTTTTRQPSTSTSSTSTSSTSSSRSGSSSSTSTSTTRSGSSSSTSTSRSAGTTRQPTTTVETRVSRDGTSRTTVKTTDEQGRTQTYKREGNVSSRQQATTETKSSQDTKGESNQRSGQRQR